MGCLGYFAVPDLPLSQRRQTEHVPGAGRPRPYGQMLAARAVEAEITAESRRHQLQRAETRV